MAAVLDLIIEALVTVKALAVGETPGADMTTDALNKFNEVLESLSIQNLAVYASLDTVVLLVANQAAYILGPGGIGQRPLSLNAIDSTFTTFNGVDYTLDLVPRSEYDLLAVKKTTGIPAWGAFDNDYPNATLFLWPVPYMAGTMTLSQKQAFTRASGLTDTFDMPPGYRRMIRLLLAWALLDDYPGMPGDQVAKLEKDKTNAVAQVKRGNIEPVLLRSEAAGMGRNGDCFTDWQNGA